ncbi:hypothetical protein ACFVH6_37205 [Spirillospora sp. NPDC127200]
MNVMSDEAGAPAGEPGAALPTGTAAPAGPQAEPTGDARVDAALARLAELAGTPVAAHVEVFEDVHQRLQELLAAADDGEPGPSGPPVPRPPAPGTAPPRPAPPRPGLPPGPRA